MLASPLVVVLAGGGGRRMGGGKPLRQLAGRRLLDRAVELARSFGCGEVAIAGSPVSPDLAGLVRLPDRDGIAGPLSGLAAALDHARLRGVQRVLIIPVDTPFLPPDLAEGLAVALDADPRTGCALAASNGREHPTCSLWNVPQAAQALDAYVATGALSLQGFAGSLGTAIVEWPEVNGCDPFFNINTHEDLAWAEARMRQLCPVDS